MMAVSRFHTLMIAVMHAAVTDTQDKAPNRMAAMTLWVPMAIAEEPALMTAVNLHHPGAARIVDGLSPWATLAKVFRSRSWYGAPFDR
jgi:hypothetical protein